MVVIGAATWVLATAIFFVALAYFIRRNALSGAVNIGFLGFIFLARPPMYALGLDVPFPPRFLVDYQETLVVALLLFVLWIVCFTTSYFVFRPFGRLGMGLFPASPPRLSSRWLMILALVATAAAVLGTLLIAAQFGSYARFVYAVKIGKELAGSYVIRQASVVAAIFCLIGLLHEIRARHSRTRTERRRSRVYLNWPVLTYLALILMNLSANYVWGNRANVGFFLVAAAFSFHQFIRPLKYWEIAGAILLLGLGLRGLAEIRTDATASVSGLISHLDNMSFWTSVATTLHLVEFDALMLAVRDLGSSFEPRGGEDFLNGLVGWIPRQLWPDKPDTFFIGGWFRRIYQPEKTNGWPITVVGSWLVNYGLVGVVLGGLVSGVVSMAVDLRYARTIHTNAFSAVMPAALGLFFLGGGYDTGAPQTYVLLVIPLFIFVAIMGLVVARSGEPAQTDGIQSTPTTAR